MFPALEWAEAQNSNAGQKYCGYGWLPDRVCSQLEQNSSNYIHCCHGGSQLPNREHDEENLKALDRNTVLMWSCLTLLIPSWNRMAVFLDVAVTVMASCPTVSMPRLKKADARQNYCGNGLLLDLDWFKLEQNRGSSRQAFHGHGQLPCCEGAESKKNES